MGNERLEYTCGADGALMVTIRFPGGYVRSFVFETGENKSVGIALLVGLRGIMHFGSSITRPSTIRAYMNAFRSFIAYIERSPHTGASTELLGSDAIERFQESMYARFPASSQQPFVQTQRVVAALRSFGQENPEKLPDDLAVRLERSVLGNQGSSVPRDAYSPYVVEQLMHACRLDLETCIKRLQAGRALAAVGQDPVDHGWEPIENRLWYAAKYGPVTSRGLAALPNTTVPAKFRTVRPLNTQIYLTYYDVLILQILISLETGLPIECVKTLKVDTLRNADRGMVDIEYVKWRRRNKPVGSLRVRDGGGKTAGGLVRIAIELTRLSRTHLKTDDLWIGYGGHGLAVPNLKNEDTIGRIGALEQLVENHGIHSEDGGPFRIELARLRKSQKALSYLHNSGDVAKTANDHSVAVMAKHYASVPEVQPWHDQAVEDGLRDALSVRTRALIVLPEEADQTNSVEQDTSVRGRADKEVELSVADRNRDVWVSQCSDFYNSPYGTPGKGCPVAVWGCLTCPNAVITASKLPAILAFRKFMVAQQHELSEREWSRSFDESWIAVQQIVEKLAPYVPEAQLIADSRDEVLHLPMTLPGIRRRKGK